MQRRRRYLVTVLAATFVAGLGEYTPVVVATGSDPIRHAQAGQILSRTSHLVKGTDAGWRLGSLLDDGVLNPIDRSLAEAILIDLAKALVPVIP